MFEGNLVDIAIWAGAIFVALLIFAFTITRLYKRATKEVGFVRTGFGGERVVMDGGALVLPVLHETMPVNMNTVRLAVERKNMDALITLDRLRIDVKAEFYVRVRPDAAPSRWPRKPSACARCTPTNSRTRSKASSSTRCARSRRG